MARRNSTLLSVFRFQCIVEEKGRWREGERGRVLFYAHMAVETGLYGCRFGGTGRFRLCRDATLDTWGEAPVSGTFERRTGRPLFAENDFRELRNVSVLASSGRRGSRLLGTVRGDLTAMGANML